MAGSIPTRLTRGMTGFGKCSSWSGGGNVDDLPHCGLVQRAADERAVHDGRPQLPDGFPGCGGIEAAGLNQRQHHLRLLGLLLPIIVVRPRVGASSSRLEPKALQEKVKVTGGVLQRLREQCSKVGGQRRGNAFHGLRRFRGPLGGHVAHRVGWGPGRVKDARDFFTLLPERVSAGSRMDAVRHGGEQQAERAVHQQPTPDFLASGRGVAGAVQESSR
jgi:hypothetical protein